MNAAPTKIFLSHKGVDKPLVREFCETLELLGLAPWLDEDAMPAGVALERALLSGFEGSCAAVFFVTPHFTDENYLATEVDYAIAQKRTKGERFAIITLAFSEGGKSGEVPALLRRYVYKEPKTRLEALREILRALPLEISGLRWKTGESEREKIIGMARRWVRLSQDIQVDLAHYTSMSAFRVDWNKYAHLSQEAKHELWQAEIDLRSAAHWNRLQTLTNRFQGRIVQAQQEMRDRGIALQGFLGTPMFRPVNDFDFIQWANKLSAEGRKLLSELGEDEKE
jgi:hypothetical protein